MRVAVIGGGAAGLACARRLTDVSENHTCVVFEQTPSIGGTWVYTDTVGKDEFGIPVHSSMYKSLRTNLPKEVMGFPDFPITKHESSYIPANAILEFLNEYAEHFKIRKNIQFHKQVVSVAPRERVWDLTVLDVRSKEKQQHEFDAVMVCNGHYWKPYFPELPGAQEFQGVQMHSHDYRSPEMFQNKRVVVIGAGPSGMDLTLEIALVAAQVIMSHHFKEEIRTQFPSNVIQKPDVLKLSKNVVKFNDGTEYQVDYIFYCTGFQYAFPFLSEDCKVRVVDNRVQPLYKHLIHIEHPTMCFIGIPFYVCAFQLFDLQARFFLEMLSGRSPLPSSQEMLADTDREIAARREAGLGPRQTHLMGPLQGRYYDELAETAGIERIHPVMSKLHNESSGRFLEDLTHYREDIYRIVDASSFVRIK